MLEPPLCWGIYGLFYIGLPRIFFLNIVVPQGKFLGSAPSLMGKHTIQTVCFPPSIKATSGVTYGAY